MISKRTLSSLLLSAALFAACGNGSAAAPDLPKSISPGWSLSSLDRVPPPPALAGSGSPNCWKANYSGPGSVEMWICAYATQTGAFDAEQRTSPAAQTVTFQEGRRLILVHYNEAKRTDLEALIRTIQNRLKE